MNKMNKFLMAGLLCSVMACSHVYAQKPVYAQDDAVRVGSRVTYDYYADSLFHVNTKLGFVTDIELKPGETITYIAGGDTTRWLIDKAMVANVQHVYIKPVEKDIKTNVIVNTNLHSYRLEVSSGENYDPLITFRFPEKESSYNNIASRYSSSSSVVKKNFDYRIKAKKNADVSLMPVEIFDDGTKTYIRMPDDNKYDLPVIYNIDPWDGKTLSMVNYRRQGDYFVVDRVMEHGRLFYHQKFYVDFYNEAIQKTKTKEYRQRETLGSRVREAFSDVGDEIREDINTITGSSDKVRGIRVYDMEDDRSVNPYERERILKEQERVEREQQKEQERIEREKQKEQARLQQMRDEELNARAEQARRLAEERELQQRRLVEQQKKEQAAQKKEQAALLKQQKAEALRQQQLREQQLEQRRIQAEQQRLAAEKERARQEELRKAQEKRQMEAKKQYEEQMRQKAEAERLRQEELRRQEAKRIAAEQKAKLAAEKERARQEALRQAELKRQEEARRVALEKQRAEEARRKEAIRLETEKRNAEIARLTELENKKLEEIRKLQEAKRQQVAQGNAAIKRIASGGNGQRQVVSSDNRSQRQVVPSGNNSQRQAVPSQKVNGPHSQELENLFASIEKSK